MNLELKDSFHQSYPEVKDGVLFCVSQPVTAQFNRLGTLLAVGCNDGRLLIWDFSTRSIAKGITAHAQTICSVSWSRNGRKILTASTDNTVNVFDVLSGECDYRFRFPSAVLKAQFNPQDSQRFLVCPWRHPALLVNLNGTQEQVPLDKDQDRYITASFDPSGQYIYTGNGKGRVSVYQTDGLELKASFRIVQGQSSTVIKQIEFAGKGNCFLVNSADRVIRVYDCQNVLEQKGTEVQPVQKIQDLVNKTKWTKVCFSSDGEYVCGGAGKHHSLYIWDKTVGTLVKILRGDKTGELLLDVLWHPRRAILVSLGSGSVTIWAQNEVENWSAFAPDFKELDFNTDYEERESEFDVYDEDKEKYEGKGKEGDEEDDLEVDVTTVEEDDEDFLMFLPISVADEVEEPEVIEKKAKCVEIDAPNIQNNHNITDKKSQNGTQERNQNETKAGKQKQKNGKESTVIDVVLQDVPNDEVHPMLLFYQKLNTDGKRGHGKKGSSS